MAFGGGVEKWGVDCSMDRVCLGWWKCSGMGSVDTI